MAWHTEDVQEADGRISVLSWNDEIDPPEKVRVFRIDTINEVVEYFPKDGFCVDVVTLDGFDDVPPEFARAGYMPSRGLQYYLNKKLGEHEIDSLSISKRMESTIRKVPRQDRYRVVISYADFRALRAGLTRINQEANSERAAFVDEHFAQLFPARYSASSGAPSARRRASRAINYLDPSIIAQLTPDEINTLMEFVTQLLAKRYTSAESRRKLLTATKVRVDEVALNEVITKFEALVNKNPVEAEWGKFLRTNLFMVDSKYIAAVPEINVALASARKMDFGLVDTVGYLDIFEIKRPSTRLLAAKEDHGNFYWHSDAVKAITQAEKYLHRAERKAADLAEDIKRERGIDVQVVRPKVIVLMGDTSQLDTPSKREDFRILRSSMKNVEVVAYDELLSRLRNQQGKIYSEPDIELRSALGSD